MSLHRPRRPALRRPLLPLGLAAVLLCATGCNFIRWKKGDFEEAFRDAGLAQRWAVLGEDTLAYWDGGRGTPVLLIEGFGPPAIWHWNEQVDALARGHRLIIPDLLWSGGGSRSTSSDYGIHHQARAIVALLDKLGLERVDVVGLSYGGFVAWVIAALHPERVGKLVMISSPGGTYTPADFRDLRARYGVDNASELFAPSDAAGVARVLQLAWADPPCAPAFARRQAVQELYADNLDEARAIMEAAETELEAADAIPTPGAPTLLVWGEHDPVFPVALARRVLDRLAGRASLEVVPGAKHAPNLEFPDLVNPLLETFLGPAPR